MKLLTRKLIVFLLAASAASFLSATDREPTAMSSASNVFWSGHSLTDPPIPEMVAEISASLGVPMRWNRHSMAGASLQARTRGRPANPNGWDGYRQGNNRDTVGMDVAEEFHTAVTVGGNGYDTLIITEVHDFLWSLLRGDTVRLLRHYHERFLDGNERGQSFFYQSWLNVYDHAQPQPWIDYERAAAPIWQCIVTRVNTSLEAEGRSDRLRFLPASLGLTHLVETATTGNGVPGITSDSVSQTMQRIFRDTVHLTDTGSYFIALVTYAFIENQSPAGAWAPDKIKPATAGALQSIAWQFYMNYAQHNVPLTLPECSARIRESFAEQYWKFLDARARHRDEPWYKKVWLRIKGPVSVRRNIREWQQAFADNHPDNPFRLEAESDADYWH